MIPIIALGGIVGPFVAGYLYDVTGTYKICLLCTAILVFISAVTINFSRPAKLPDQAVV